ncbi:MAG: hypothetical protein P4L50_21525 [Anaerolineaceae bacterium]|nr:hypothetical protein [Anaerolineaceae bacterium]
MQSNRIFWFSFSIVIGITAGLVFGWVVEPRRFAESAPSTLRADYKADYALMVAEVYQKDKDLTLAVSRLALLGNDLPVRTVQEAIITASELGYTRQDLQLLGKLSQALGSPLSSPTPAMTKTPEATPPSGGTP